MSDEYFMKQKNSLVSLIHSWVLSEEVFGEGGWTVDIDIVFKTKISINIVIDKPSDAIEIDPDILNVDVKHCGFSTRITNVLTNAKLKFVRDIVTKKKKDLLYIRGLGSGILKEIEDFLKVHGLRLDMDI